MAGVVAQSTLEYSLAVNAASEIAPFNLIYLALGLALLPFWCALSLLRWVTGQPSADSRLQVGPDIDFHTDSLVPNVWETYMLTFILTPSYEMYGRLRC
jgi:hypothetical protein